jgi:hypothetical protein
MSLLEGSQSVPQQAFSQWNDPHGNKLIAQQRDGSLYCQAVQFANGSLLNASTSISPLNYGAKWDGVSEDTIAIQQAINVAQQGGGYVQMPVGTAHITSTLYINSSVKIAGSAHFGANGSYLLYSGTGTAIQVGKTDNSLPVYAVTLQDFGVQSAGHGDKGIACYTLSEALFNLKSCVPTATGLNVTRTRRTKCSKNYSKSPTGTSSPFHCSV